MRILVVNPNTTASMTHRIGAAAKAAAASGTAIRAVNPDMGPASIEGFYDEAFALPGLLHAIRDGEDAGYDAYVIACFDDTGLDAARALARGPVVGICEAGVHCASLLANRFSIVTTLARSIVPIEALVARYGAAGRCRVRAADVPVLALEDPASQASARVREEIGRALEHDRAEAVLLGCAGMTDLAQRFADEFGVPVLDGVACAVKLAEALVALGLRTSKVGSYAYPLAKAYAGELARFAPPRR
jgi:allantoin racemase